MELGICGPWAIVGASSQVLGRACAEVVAAEGVNVIVNGRDADKLEKAAAEIAAAARGEIVPVAADLNVPNATALALGTYGREAGTVSALLGVLPFAVGAVASPLASIAGKTAQFSWRSCSRWPPLRSWPVERW